MQYFDTDNDGCINFDEFLVQHETVEEFIGENEEMVIVLRTDKDLATEIQRVEEIKLNRRAVLVNNLMARKKLMPSVKVNRLLIFPG